MKKATEQISTVFLFRRLKNVKCASSSTASGVSSLSSSFAMRQCCVFCSSSSRWFLSFSEQVLTCPHNRREAAVEEQKRTCEKLLLPYC